MSDFASYVARTLTGACSTFSDVLCILHLSRIQILNSSNGGTGKTIRPCSLTMRCSDPGRRDPVAIVAASRVGREYGSFDLLFY